MTRDGLGSDPREAIGTEHERTRGCILGVGAALSREAEETDHERQEPIGHPAAITLGEILARLLAFDLRSQPRRLPGCIR